MTTVRHIIADAFRESGLIPIGGTPTAEEQAEALFKLQGIVKGLFGASLGENLQTITFGSEGLIHAHHPIDPFAGSFTVRFVPSNYRLMCNLGSDQSIYLDPNPSDGARLQVIDNLDNFSSNSLTLVGNGRQIEDASSLVLNTNGLNREWFYRADLGTWTRITDIDDNSDSPLPVEFDDYLITRLALRINPRMGVVTSQETASALARIESQFKARYRQKKEVGSEEGLSTIHPYNTLDDFNLGI